jgi:hypothetical protein
MPTKLKPVWLIRQLRDDKQTLGIWTTVNGKEIFVCRTLELSWKDNQNDISCIPTGEYVCRWTLSPRLSQLKGKDVYTYEILDVPNRTGVRIHSANYFYQLKGCVALGDAHKDLNADNELDIIHSGNTVDAFNKIMDKKDFKLMVIEEIV